MAERAVTQRVRRKITTVDVKELMRRMEEGMKVATKLEKTKLRRELKPPSEYFRLRRVRS